MHRKLWAAGIAALLVGLASAAWAAFDSPDGDPPFGIDFSGNPGPGYEGVVTMIFPDYSIPELSASGFAAVVRLRKGGVLHVFHERYDCETADSCALCIDPDGVGNPLPPRLDVGQINDIQLCVQDLIEPDVVTAFGLGSASVQIKNMSSFVSEVDPSDSSVRVVAADIDVTAK